ncbi:polysaccharide deacetylase family protein [Pedosphaera parvula]|uniref:Polysaccharide deacetylase n=1 Tax=Pedosphaera parvula (strain Ellin514) TaxID=320771 RepID=B9XD21_PEDPL|nr:polysaccharide deacetylase family protein [Pedosphaera parvula]EEF62367.1 polysaccharide deacetylase [Pedosphaera parvula Ellin514]
MPAVRFDRLLTLSLARPFGCIGLGGNKERLPILMYHSISTDVESGTSDYYKTCTSPKVFAEQMAVLSSEGYQAVSLAEGLKRTRDGKRADGKNVVITFDDGFRDFHTEAFPVLKKYGFGATMFLPTAYIGNEVRRFKDRECMTWNEVREMRKAGIEFGSHTVNHPILYQLDFKKIRAEIEQSKSVIEAELGEPIGSFAYPYAFPSADRGFVGEFVGLLKEAGYAQSVTTRIGRVGRRDDPFTLKRLPVNSADDTSLFVAKMDGAYDWMALPQDAIKGVKCVIGRGQRATKN